MKSVITINSYQEIKSKFSLSSLLAAFIAPFSALGKLSETQQKLAQFSELNNRTLADIGLTPCASYGISRPRYWV